PTTDSRNCGACGNVCPSLVCQNGRCLSEDEADRVASGCAGGEVFCAREDGYCADLQTNSLNCGACGNACLVGDCVGGACGGGGLQNCAPPLSVCGDACVDLTSDSINCGACGVTCGADDICLQGMCRLGCLDRT